MQEFSLFVSLDIYLILEEGLFLTHHALRHPDLCPELPQLISTVLHLFISLLHLG